MGFLHTVRPADGSRCARTVVSTVVQAEHRRPSVAPVPQTRRVWRRRTRTRSVSAAKRGTVRQDSRRRIRARMLRWDSFRCPGKSGRDQCSTKRTRWSGTASSSTTCNDSPAPARQMPLWRKFPKVRLPCPSFTPYTTNSQRGVIVADAPAASGPPALTYDPKWLAITRASKPHISIEHHEKGYSEEAPAHAVVGDVLSRSAQVPAARCASRMYCSL